MTDFIATFKYDFYYGLLELSISCFTVVRGKVAKRIISLSIFELQFLFFARI